MGFCFMFIAMLTAAVVAAPTAKVESSVMEGSKLADHSVHKTLSFIDLFLQADLVVQSVLVVLIVMSIWGWAIIFDKTVFFKLVNRRIKKFQKEFWSGKSLDALLKDANKESDANPLAQVLIAAIDEWRLSNKPLDSFAKANLKDRIKQIMQITSNKMLGNLSDNMGFLASSGSIAPFIGLFGTVWGVMDSFLAIAASKNTTLAAVGPGIAEALFATAIGLVAAIPASLFYKKFAIEIDKIWNNVDDFCLELHTIISREIDNTK